MPLLCCSQSRFAEGFDIDLGHFAEGMENQLQLQLGMILNATLKMDKIRAQEFAKAQLAETQPIQCRLFRSEKLLKRDKAETRDSDSDFLRELNGI